MKTSLLLLSVLLSTKAFASGAVSYDCVGKNATTNESVVFELDFSDSDPQAGYTNQAVTIEKIAGNALAKPLVLQMYGANKKNDCKLNSEHETYMASGFSMEPAQANSPAAYEVSFVSNCNAKQKLDVKGYCFFQAE